MTKPAYFALLALAMLLVLLCSLWSCKNPVMPYADAEKNLQAQLDSTLHQAQKDTVALGTISWPKHDSIGVSSMQGILGMAVDTPSAVPVPRITKAPKTYDNMLLGAMHRNWPSDYWDFPYLKGLCWQESRLDPNAESQVHAMGIGQLMYATAKDLGATSPEMLHDPKWNIEATTRYIEMLRKFFSDKPIKTYEDHLALQSSAYNTGMGRVNKLCRVWGYSFHDIYSYLPKETQGYWPHIRLFREYIYLGYL